MDRPEPLVVLVADGEGPGVQALARVLPSSTIRMDSGELPESWPTDGTGPALLVIHRRHLADADAERLRRFRRATPFVRILLIVGPHVRYERVQRWSALVDAVIPEAIASDILPRHVEGLGRLRPRIRTGTVCVVSLDFELRTMLTEACRRAGFEAIAARDWGQAPPASPALWDVPALEPDWPQRLAAAAASRPVIALIGFADQQLADQARRHGAAACLDLPCDPADLAAVLESISGSLEPVRRDSGHAEPPRRIGTTGPRRLARRDNSS